MVAEEAPPGVTRRLAEAGGQCPLAPWRGMVAPTRCDGEEMPCAIAQGIGAAAGASPQALRRGVVAPPWIFD